VLSTARHDFESVVGLTRDLVAIPSQGGIDSYQPVLDRMAAWLQDRNLPVAVLSDTDGALVGLTSEIRGAGPGPRWVLDACLDTAPFGNEQVWTYPPTSPVVKDGWLWGRGSADSKSGAAIFCHIAARLADMTGQTHGSLVLLFDVDEHTAASAGPGATSRAPAHPVTWPG
jgi:succinyl-diaminopimelate desuccinylase